jgi:hypothetical protein
MRLLTALGRRSQRHEGTFGTIELDVAAAPGTAQNTTGTPAAPAAPATRSGGPQGIVE